jgi:hypothetical protein
MEGQGVELKAFLGSGLPHLWVVRCGVAKQWLWHPPLARPHLMTRNTCILVSYEGRLLYPIEVRVQFSYEIEVKVLLSYIVLHGSSSTVYMCRAGVWLCGKQALCLKRCGFTVLSTLLWDWCESDYLVLAISVPVLRFSHAVHTLDTYDLLGILCGMLGDEVGVLGYVSLPARLCMMCVLLYIHSSDTWFDRGKGWRFYYTRTSWVKLKRKLKWWLYLDFAQLFYDRRRAFAVEVLVTWDFLIFLSLLLYWRGVIILFYKYCLIKQ